MAPVTHWISAADDAASRPPVLRRSDPAGDHERTLRGGEAVRDLLQRLRRDPRFPGDHRSRRPGQGGEEFPGQRCLRGLPLQDLPEQEGEEAPFPSRPEDEPAVRVGPGERHMGLHVVPEEIAPGPGGGDLPRVGDGGDVGFEEVRADRQQEIGLLDPVMGEVPFAEQEAVRLLFGGVAIHLVFGKPLDPEFFAGGVDEPGKGARRPPGQEEVLPALLAGTPFRDPATREKASSQEIGRSFPPSRAMGPRSRSGW